MRRSPLLVVFLLAMIAPACAAEHVVFRQDGRQHELDGRLVVEAQDGGLLLMGRDGFLWAIPPDQQIKRTSNDTPFQPLSPGELAAQMLAELPKGFDVHHTAHYLICYDTPRAYAQWCGSLFERLYMAFTNYWTRQGLKLTEPEFPLVAIVFSDRAAYLKFSQAELGKAAETIIGYYSLRSNRMTMYDLTGVAARGRLPRNGAAAINQLLSQPDALRNVATIVHEATHQIAFNCGLHVRFSDCPRWFNEGIAVYFETPDLTSAKGWRAVGMVNQPRLEQFLRFLPNRPADSLKTLLCDDARFRDPKQALDAYAESWALTYYLIRQRPKQYIAYLQMLSQKKPLLEDAPQKRLEQFEDAFGDWNRLDAEFVRYMSRVR